MLQMQPRLLTVQVKKPSRCISKVSSSTSLFHSTSRRQRRHIPLCRQISKPSSHLLIQQQKYNSHLMVTIRSMSQTNYIVPRNVLSSSVTPATQTIIESGNTSSSGSSQQTYLGLFSSMFLLASSLLLSSTPYMNSITKQEALKEPTSKADKNEEEEEEEDLPIYKMSQVALNNGQNGKPIWMTYGGKVYDVTNFIPNHPGGSEHILKAAGSCIEPFWNLYRQHFATDLPMNLMEQMVIGTLDETDQDRIDSMMEKNCDENDPYKHEPIRHPALKVHGEQPMNAEVPKRLITENYLTPTDLFYIRHHHPVPNLSPTDIKNYRLEIDLTALGRPSIYLTLDEIRSLPKHEITATLQCSGNRRSNFNTVARTSGTPWEQGAISTAKFGGPKLRDILIQIAGLSEEEVIQYGLEHVRFESLDGMKASVGIEKALSHYGDCIVAYEMNDAPLPPDHGYPIRSIVPGYCAVRNVKWVKKIELAETEAEGAWQRGLNYKVLPKKITNAKGIDLSKMPSLREASLFSGITNLEQVKIDNNTKQKQKQTPKPGDIVTIKASGWAWAGGGRNVVRIDLTGDGGKTWTPAEITLGGDQKFNRAWAWVFWTCDDILAVVDENGEVEICSKAVDAAMNSQPENCDHMWNIRGLGDNSWFRSRMKF